MSSVEDGVSAQTLFNHRAKGPASYEYDDVVFLPTALSSVASSISLSTSVSRNVSISLPVVVSAVADSTTAASVAAAGGIVVSRSAELIRACKSLRRPDINSATKGPQGRWMFAAAIGTQEKEDRLEELVKAGADVIVLDGGDERWQSEMIGQVKQKYPDLDVVGGGDVVTARQARNLIAGGADGLRVGVRRCQASAIYEVATVAAQSGVPVMADGVDISKAGHVAKALLLGASSVMINSTGINDEELILDAMEVVKDSLQWMGASSLQSVHQLLHSDILRLELVTPDSRKKEELRVKHRSFWNKIQIGRRN